jgi:hypothetical protein
MTIASFRSVIGAVGAVLLCAGSAFANDVPTVPEPATMTLMAMGGAGMYLLNRRRRK